MKKKLLMYLLILTAAVMIFTGCATNTDSEVSFITTDDTSHATPKGEGWMISLSGVRADEMWESNFETWKNAPSAGYGDYEFERKGEIISFKAMPLKNIVAIIDDSDASMPYSFKEDLWKSGYDLTFTASDGYSLTVNTADISMDALYIADFLNGEKINPMICGNISTQLWVKDLAEVSASLEAISLENNDFELLLEIGSKSGAYKISELENMDFYIEDKGSFTNTYDNTFEFVWGGVKIIDLINNYTTLSKDMSVTIESMDGYAMNYSGEQLLDNADGDWILAFKENGEYMAEDPGYIRLVKVGPESPNFLGHVSARMVKKIIIKDTTFKNFELKIISPAGIEVMDAQTLMSGVTNSRTVVDAWDNKKENTYSYMGMPVYMILERYTGYTKVTVEADDGYSVTLDASELAGNNDVIIGMFKGDGSELEVNDFPLVIAWDKDSALVPAGIKAVRNISKIIIE